MIVGDKKKILIFIPKLCVGGGAERASLDLGKGLAQKYDISFLTLHIGDILQQNIHCLDQSESFLSRAIGIFTNGYYLRRYCKKYNIDIVISNLPRTNTSTMIAKIFFRNKTKNILVTHSAYHNGLQNMIMMRLFWNWADKNIVVARAAEASLNRIGVTNTTTIYNPFDFKSINLKLLGNIEEKDQNIFSDGDFVFISIGRLHEVKAQKYILSVFAKLHKSYINTKLVILGEGPLRKELETQIKQLGLQGSVFLLGNRKNVFPYLKKADCFVLSSNREGLPTVLIEAGYVGLPLISTDCLSGPREILSPETDINEKLQYPHTGLYGVLVVAPMHNENEFERTMLSGMINAIKGRARGPSKEAFTSRFSTDNILKEWEKVLTK